MELGAEHSGCQSFVAGEYGGGATWYIDLELNQFVELSAILLCNVNFRGVESQTPESFAVSQKWPSPAQCGSVM